MSLVQIRKLYLRCSIHLIVSVKSTSASADIFLTDFSPSINGTICIVSVKRKEDTLCRVKSQFISTSDSNWTVHIGT